MHCLSCISLFLFIWKYQYSLPSYFFIRESITKDNKQSLEQKETLSWGCFLSPHCLALKYTQGSIITHTHTHTLQAYLCAVKSHSQTTFVSAWVLIQCASLLIRIPGDWTMSVFIVTICNTQGGLLPGKAIKISCNWRGLSGKCCCFLRTKGWVFIQIWQMSSRLLFVHPKITHNLLCLVLCLHLWKTKNSQSHQESQKIRCDLS